MTRAPAGERFASDEPLPAMDVSRRIERLRANIGDSEATSLVVTNMTNVRYLTGFTGSAAMLFVLPAYSVLLTDGRYGIQAEEELAAAGVAVRLEVARAADQPQAAKGIVDGALAKGSALALEAAHVSWARQRAFADNWFTGFELLPTEGLVEHLRAVKDRGEIARVARAAGIADEALSAVLPMLADSPREVDFAQALDSEMRRLGAAGPSFETIVASGTNAAKPHHRPSAAVIGRGVPVVLDFGALFEGYCSDMTRTVWVDELEDEHLRRAVNVVACSQAAGVRAVRAGAAAKDVDAACRDAIEAEGLGHLFVHGTGHGVGLAVHEAPSVAATSPDTLAAGQVVTVEPGVYLAGVGGVRIEDTVAVTADGCETLTRTPKDLP